MDPGDFVGVGAGGKEGRVGKGRMKCELENDHDILVGLRDVLAQRLELPNPLLLSDIGSDLGDVSLDKPNQDEPRASPRRPCRIPSG